MKKKYLLPIIIFCFNFISAGWQDWIPSYFKKTATPIEEISVPASTYTLPQLLQDPALNKKAYRDLEQSIQRDEYQTHPVFTDKNKNITVEQRLRSNIYEQKSYEKKLDAIKNDWFKKIIIYSTLGGATGTISAIILRQLISPRYSGISSLAGYGAVAGFTGGYWRLAQQEKEKKEAIEILKKERSL